MLFRLSSWLSLQIICFCSRLPWLLPASTIIDMMKFKEIKNGLICPACGVRSVPNKWTKISVKIVECLFCGDLIEIEWRNGRLSRRKADGSSFTKLRKELERYETRKDIVIVNKDEI